MMVLIFALQDGQISLKKLSKLKQTVQSEKRNEIMAKALAPYLYQTGINICKFSADHNAAYI